MSDATGEELAAKSRIMAALIAHSRVDVGSVIETYARAWDENQSLVRLNQVVQRLYEVTRTIR